MSITATLPLIFDAIDTNNDEAIELGEFQAYFASLGGKVSLVSAKIV
jgi:hypothetical protein